MKVSVKIKDGEQFFVQLPVLPRVGDELFLQGGTDTHCYKVTDVVFYLNRVETAANEKMVIFTDLVSVFVEQSKF